MPQIIMLNHAAWVNHERGERRYNANKDKGDDGNSNAPRNPTTRKERDGFRVNGKKLDELTTEEFMRYWNAEV